MNKEGLKYLLTKLKDIFATKTEVSNIQTNGVDKLSTPRKIFGQDFDGSSDVTGNITLTGNIELTDDNLTIGSTSKQFKMGYFKWISSSENSPLRISSYDGADDIFISTDHKVGIGTIEPEEKLHIDGKLKIGTIVLEDRNGVLYMNDSPIGSNSSGDEPSGDEPEEKTPETYLWISANKKSSYIGENITFTATEVNTSYSVVSYVEGAIISINDTQIGITGSDGKFIWTSDRTGSDITVKASKSGFLNEYDTCTITINEKPDSSSESGSTDSSNVINIDTTNLSSGTYTLKYIDDTGNPISGVDDITTITV